MPRSISESARLSYYDIAVVDEKLRRALIRPADHWQQSSELLARDKTQGSAFRTGQHGPIRILFLPHSPGVLQNVENLFGRGFQIDGSTVSEQVIFRGTADRLRQTLAEFALEKTHDLAHSLKREATAPQLAYHGDLGQIFH